jgi:RND family efflux transporter MFP subunit
VPEAEAEQVAKGSKIRYKAPGGKGEPIETGISRTSWSLNETSRTLQVEVDIANADGQWRPGSYVQASLVAAEIPDAICIPKTAMFLQNKQAYCYVIGADGALEKRPIEVGASSVDELHVRKGLTGGENLIGRNVGSFREGQLVELAAPAAK